MLRVIGALPEPLSARLSVAGHVQSMSKLLSASLSDGGYAQSDRSVAWNGLGTNRSAAETAWYEMQ